MIFRRRHAFYEITKSLRGTYIWQRGKSHTASAQELPKTLKIRKRITKDERKAMLESYVYSYKVLNDGKFPTVSAATKQVGGSYYVIRKFLQELEHKSRNTEFEETNEGSVIKKHSKENESVSAARKLKKGFKAESINIEEVKELEVPKRSFLDKAEEYSAGKGLAEEHASNLGSQIFEDGASHDSHSADSVKNVILQVAEKSRESEVNVCSTGMENDKENSSSDSTLDLGQTLWNSSYAVDTQVRKVVNANADHVEEEEGVQTYTSTVEASNEMMKPTAVVKRHGDEVEKIEVANEKMASMDVLDVDGREHRSEQNQAPHKVDNVAVEDQHSHDNELPKRSNLWENLKSLADGIASMWRKH